MALPSTGTGTGGAISLFFLHDEIRIRNINKMLQLFFVNLLPEIWMIDFISQHFIGKTNRLMIKIT
jgi:hypothetical protein